MTTLTEGMRLQRPNNEKVTIEIVEINEKFKTAMVKAKDGKTYVVTFATLKDKRSWVESTEETQTVTVEPKVEEVPVVEEQPKEEPKKVEKKATKKATKKTTSTAKFMGFDFNLKYELEMNDFTVKTWDKIANTLSVSKDGKRIANIYTRRNAVTIVTKHETLSSTQLEKADHGFTFKTVYEYGVDEQHLMTAIKDILMNQLV